MDQQVQPEDEEEAQRHLHPDEPGVRREEWIQRDQHRAHEGRSDAAQLETDAVHEQHGEEPEHEGRRPDDQLRRSADGCQGGHQVDVQGRVVEEQARRPEPVGSGRETRVEDVTTDIEEDVLVEVELGLADDPDQGQAEERDRRHERTPDGEPHRQSGRPGDPPALRSPIRSPAVRADRAQPSSGRNPRSASSRGSMSSSGWSWIPSSRGSPQTTHRPGQSGRSSGAIGSASWIASRTAVSRSSS